MVLEMFGRPTVSLMLALSICITNYHCPIMVLVFCFYPCDLFKSEGEAAFVAGMMHNGFHALVAQHHHDVLHRCRSSCWGETRYYCVVVLFFYYYFGKCTVFHYVGRSPV